MKTCSKDDCDYPSFSKGYCRNHQYLRVDKSVPTLRKSAVRPVMNPQAYPKRKVRHPTGEKKLFEQIYNERVKKCELCDTPIYSFNVSNFHHIKPKGTYPELRLVRFNIQFICFTCHFNIHNN